MNYGGGELKVLRQVAKRVKEMGVEVKRAV